MDVGFYSFPPLLPSENERRRPAPKWQQSELGWPLWAGLGHPLTMETTVCLPGAAGNRPALTPCSHHWPCTPIPDPAPSWTHAVSVVVAEPSQRGRLPLELPGARVRGVSLCVCRGLWSRTERALRSHLGYG